MIEIKERYCSGCNTIKVITDFVKDKYDKTGYTYRCKICRSIKQKEWVKNNKEKVRILNLKNREKRKIYYSSPEGIESSRRAHLKRMFNLTLEEFNQKLEEQNYRCALCEGTETRDKHKVFAVDHDHSNGKIRGLLCWKCNSGLGLFNDNTILLEKAINYLKLHKN